MNLFHSDWSIQHNIAHWPQLHLWLDDQRLQKQKACQRPGGDNPGQLIHSPATVGSLYNELLSGPHGPGLDAADGLVSE